MWCIYIHRNKINGKCYIGKTANIEQRWENAGVRYHTCPRFWSAIVHYGWDQFTHEILKDNLTAEEANELEKYYIEYYSAIYPNGYNLAQGGTGGSTWTGKTEEEKIKYAEERRQDTLSRGKEWHDKLSQKLKNNWDNGIRSKEKLSARMTGGNNPIAKSCICVEDNLKFSSYADAATYYGYKRSNGSKIGEVIRGQRKTACGGRHWKEGD